MDSSARSVENWCLNLPQKKKITELPNRSNLKMAEMMMAMLKSLQQQIADLHEGKSDSAEKPTPKEPSKRVVTEQLTQDEIARIPVQLFTRVLRYVPGFNCVDSGKESSLPKAFGP
jgi:hypothetical protein